MKKIIVCLLLSSIVYAQQKPNTALPQGPPGTVTLPLAEYDRLLERVARRPKQPEPAPLPFILSRAGFKLNLADNTITGTLDLEGEVLRKGATKVPLTTGLTILEARQADRPLPLMREGATHMTVLTGPAAFSVGMNIAAAVNLEAGRASFTLPVPAAGSAQIALDVPGNHTNIRIEPGLVTRRATANGHTMIEATLQPGKPARVWWTTREAAAPVAQREARYLVDVKTLISVGDSEIRSAALCEVTVIQGEPAEFKVALPAGFEVTDATGSTLVSSEVKSGALVLSVSEPARRAHQFLIVLERSNQERKIDAPLLSFAEAQRETGEVLVEGVGAMELTATEGAGLKRIDVREASAIFQSLAQHPLQAAFRLHRRPGDTPRLSLEWSQFPDSSVLSAIAEQAVVTTLLNVEGKSLTEVTLRLRNHAQPFMRVELPQGASLLSAEVEGEKVKPVQGSDGSRVPLLRAGFRPSGSYTVSFVILNSGASFGKSGSYEMGLPKVDIPVSLLRWEVFLPDRLQVKQFEGNALPTESWPPGDRDLAMASDDESAVVGPAPGELNLARLEAGQLGGIVFDPNGAMVVNATVTVTDENTGSTQSTVTDAQGRWAVFGLRTGVVRVRVEAQGFKSSEYHQLDFNASRSTLISSHLEVAGAAEQITVQGTARIDRESRSAQIDRESRRLQQEIAKSQQAQINAPSSNVINFQRKVAGILPVRVEVPRAGKSYRFVRPLILEEETTIKFRYRLK